MAASQQADEEGVPEVNGHALDTLDRFEKAMSYLKQDYNDGYLTRTIGGDRIVMISRGSRCEHWESIRDSPLTVCDVTCTGDGRSRIEVKE